MNYHLIIAMQSLLMDYAFLLPHLPRTSLSMTLHPSFLKTFLNICNRYGIKWRYDFNHSKSGIATFGETKPHHFKSLKNRERFLGDTKIEELYEHKNIGVLNPI